MVRKVYMSVLLLTKKIKYLDFLDFMDFASKFYIKMLHLDANAKV